MAKLVFAMNVTLDGYVDHQNMAPSRELFRHFIEQVRGACGLIYGRGLYEVMQYWDDDMPDWGDDARDYAAAWREKPKWVVSRTLKSVGPNATLISNDAEAAIRRLKTGLPGELDIGGPALAHSLAGSGLIDEYRMYLRPVVRGSGKPFFAGAQPPLRLVAHEEVGEALRLTYVPA